MRQPTLNPSHLRQLRAPFAVSEHGFVNNNPYIKKSAIRQRLTLVDPAWQLGQPQLVTATDDLVVMSVPLTVLGVTRWGLGTGIIQRTKKVTDADGVIRTDPLTGFDLARMIAKAYKTAASDGLPRAAVEFGVGEYLKDVPKSVRNEAALARWLAQVARQIAVEGEDSTPPAEAPQEPPQRVIRFWLDAPGAAEALEVGLKRFNLDREKAEALIRPKTWSSFATLSAALRAVEEAQRERLIIEDPA